jgi:hypothetical protein
LPREIRLLAPCQVIRIRIAVVPRLMQRDLVGCSTNANENNSNKESEGVLFVIIVPMFLLVNSQCDLHSSSCDYSLQVY